MVKKPEIILTDEEEKFILRLRQLSKSGLIDIVTVRLGDMAITEKRGTREEVFRPAGRAGAVSPSS
jgi:hypothetical protein